jgi:hypothetical protein
MFEWLRSAFASDPPIQLDVLLFRLALAFVFGGAVAGIYWSTHRRDETLVPSFLSTLVLLSILIAMVTQVIGDKLARAFALVGALSIVRFRTVVEDTRDTAFVIFAVVVGMAAGAGYPEVALVGLPIVGLAAAVMRPRPPSANGSTSYWHLGVRVGLAADPESVLAGTFRQHLAESQLLSSGTGRQGAALDLAYKVRFLPTASPNTLVVELNRLEGVQSVELRRFGT